MTARRLCLLWTSGPPKPATAERGLPLELARIFAAETRGEAMENARHGPRPVVDLMQVGPTQQIVTFWEGPDRPTRVTAMQGDDLVFHFPDPRSGVFRVTLT